MNRIPFAPVVAVVSALACGWGCGGQHPSNAQRSVEKALPEAVKELAAKELDELFQAKNQKDSRLPIGRVYDVQGTIKGITVQEKSDKRAEHYAIQVVVKDYAAAVVACQFSAEHKQALASLKVGEAVKVRGQLSSELHLFQGNAIYLNGCIIQR